ncbi:MAG TPA: PEGA domain-containing protein, partial [Kofleriaceae bacterium]
MLARRIIAVSPDKAFGKQLAIALRAAGGAVDAHASVEELGTGDVQAALVVVHLGDDSSAARGLLDRLVGDTRLIAILPRSSLVAVVDLMQASDRVAGLLVAEDFDARQLAAMATRVLAGDIFGLEKLVPWGTRIHNALVGDYQEKSLCIAQVSELAETMSVRRKYREPIEQCLDEMLMNALYDAPVDEQGQQIFSEIPTKTRISLRVEQKVVVQYACDGKRFSIAVRDAFGTLERATVLRYLHKCLHAEQQIDRKIGGAGLGLYLMTNSSTEVYFNVLPGVATEAVCVFDLEQPKLQLTSFGFFAEKIDAAGRLALGEIRRLPAHPVERRAAPAPSRRGLIAVLLASIAVVLGLVVAVAWSQLSGPEVADVAITTKPAGATLEIEGKHAGTTAEGGLLVRGLEIGHTYPVVARLEGYEPRAAIIQPRASSSAVTLELKALPATVVFDSVPTGASVEIAGEPAGTTPLTLATLAPGSTQEVRFAKPGYQAVVTRLDVPKAGKELRLVQPLAMSADLARVKLVSDPPGATVIRNGQLLAGMTTPVEVVVEANKPVRFTLALPGKVPALIPPFTPTGLAERTVTFVDGAPVRVRASVEGTGSIAGAPHCQGLPVPFECMLAPGRYTLEVTPDKANRVTRRFAVETQPVDLTLELGFVEAATGKQLMIGSAAVRRAAFEVGPRRVTIK